MQAPLFVVKWLLVPGKKGKIISNALGSNVLRYVLTCTSLTEGSGVIASCWSWAPREWCLKSGGFEFRGIER
jgi:hypothetical protein